MEELGVLLTFTINPYLTEELGRRCKLFCIWESPPSQRRDFLRTHSQSIRAVATNTVVGIDAETIEALPRLEIVSCHGVGMDKVDLNKCRERGIRITNAPGVLTEDVADLAIALSIAVLRRICASDRYLRSGAWKARGYFELTSRIRLIVNREVIDALGFNGVHINIGRGGNVDEAELVSALLEGRLGGAGLDVFEREPEVPAELAGLDNVVLAPHVGTGTWETRKAMGDLALANLEAHARNKPLLTPVI